MKLKHDCSGARRLFGLIGEDTSMAYAKHTSSAVVAAAAVTVGVPVGR